jgi:hypothetical protein
MIASVMTGDPGRLAEFCRIYHIARLALFGSVLRESFRPDSDVDVLVEFEPGHVPGFIGLGTIELELAPFFGGRRIDLHTAASIFEGFRSQVLAEAEVQYDAP